MAAGRTSFNTCVAESSQISTEIRPVEVERSEILLKSATFFDLLPLERANGYVIWSVDAWEKLVVITALERKSVRKEGKKCGAVRDGVS